MEGLTPRQPQAELIAELETLSVGRLVRVGQAPAVGADKVVTSEVLLDVSPRVGYKAFIPSSSRRPMGPGDAVAKTVVLAVETMISVSVVTVVVKSTLVTVRVLNTVVVSIAVSDGAPIVVTAAK